MSRLVAVVPGVTFADGSIADVTLWESAEPVAEPHVFAAMVVLTDQTGRYAAVYSPRRQEWGSPGGWRERGESAVQCALRELWEETGIRLEPGALRACGHEDFIPRSLNGRWPAEGGSIQLFRAEIADVGGELVSAEPDAVDPRWVTAQEFAALSGARFWWPLIETLASSGTRAREQG
jgi:8-oxo-dGTP pyrophosphatase MutT (NUDIX family)